MTMYQVTYEILTEARTDSFMGSGSSFMQNLTTVVTANSPNQACDMVQNMNGGWGRCRAQFAIPLS